MAECRWCGAEYKYLRLIVCKHCHNDMCKDCIENGDCCGNKETRKHYGVSNKEYREICAQMNAQIQSI